MKDYLILHRQILHWEWHDDAYMLSLFIHLLCMANYLPNYKYRGKVQRVGELHTSVPKLALLTGISQNTIISKLRKLQSTGEIKFTSSKNGTDIYIVNYAKYQFVAGGAGEQVAEQFAEPIEERFNEPFAEQNAEQFGAQVAERQPKSANLHAGSPACSAKGYATVAEQVADNQINTNTRINNNIIKEKNIKKEKGCALNNAELEVLFNYFRKAYKGTKRGLTVELDNLKRKCPNNWREIIPCLMPALEREIEWREQMAAAGQFVPQWAHLQTWINQQRWETEFETVETAKAASHTKAAAPASEQPPTDDEYGGSFGGADY